LRFERRWAQGAAVAADDVYPITYGGLVKVLTRPNCRAGDSIEDGEVLVEHVSHDPAWIAEHVVVAFDPHGERHDVPNLLADLCADPKAKTFVAELSNLAQAAADAISKRSVHDLASTITKYKVVVDGWMNGRHLSHTSDIAAKLLEAMPNEVAGWKPPGAGASKSIIVIVREKPDRTKVIDFFAAQGWTAIPAYVTTGVSGEFLTADGHVRLTAGHRIDFVGGADIGQDVSIGVEGTCCSCAIEPRSELVISTTPPKARARDDPIAAVRPQP
jgi:hypothetical protein